MKITIFIGNLIDLLELRPVINYIYSRNGTVSILLAAKCADEGQELSQQWGWSAPDSAVGPIISIPSIPYGRFAAWHRYRVEKRYIEALLASQNPDIVIIANTLDSGLKTAAAKIAWRRNVPVVAMHVTAFNADDLRNIAPNTPGWAITGISLNRILYPFLKNMTIQIDGRLFYTNWPHRILFAKYLGVMAIDLYWRKSLSPLPWRFVVTEDDAKRCHDMGVPVDRIYVTGHPRDDEIILSEEDARSLRLLLCDSHPRIALFSLPPFDQLGIHNNNDVLNIIYELEKLTTMFGFNFIISPHPRLSDDYIFSLFSGNITKNIRREPITTLMPTLDVLIATGSSTEFIADRTGIPTIDLTWLHNMTDWAKGTSIICTKGYSDVAEALTSIPPWTPRTPERSCKRIVDAMYEILE
ncbi:hypothetical protein [Magnetospirillum fulvum]|uniref:hypothetical protein n=1 Tax=Magnetospirillum fulvum TaxID=1082 RepID=UPI0003FA8359|nr:hypothetical protein [Magnetospirillum fulvum]